MGRYFLLCFWYCWVFKEAYIIQELKDFGFTKFYMIVVSHFFSENPNQSLILPC